MPAIALSHIPSSLNASFHSVLASQLGSRPKDGPGHAMTCTPEVDPVDVNRLLDMADDKPAVLREIVSMYLSESNNGIGELWASIQAGDWDQSERLAHRIGGTAAMCGMVGLVAPLRAIEVEAGTGRWSRIQTLMLEVRMQQRRVIDSLARHGLSGPPTVAAAPKVEEGR